MRSSKKPFSSPYGLIHWYTWSNDFRELFSSMRKSTWFLSIKPTLQHIEGYDDYNYTYALDRVKLHSLKEIEIWKECSLDLYHFRPHAGLVFLTGLISKDITAVDFHKIFTIIRSLIVAASDNEMEALYTPLTASNKGYFPLHCDLYIPKKLMNVYEAVPTDNSGASLFLRMDTLIDTILPKIEMMSKSGKQKILSIIQGDDRSDKYEMFYDLLNGTNNPWYRELRSRTNQYKFGVIPERTRVFAI